jgi:hypothetical protein
LNPHKSLKDISLLNPLTIVGHMVMVFIPAANASLARLATKTKPRSPTAWAVAVTRLTLASSKLDGQGLEDNKRVV